MIRTIARIAVLVTFCVALAGCGGSDEPKGPGYAPIPDKQLFAQIAAIPGVTTVGLSYRDEFGNSNDYVGEIGVDPAANAATVLDHAIAILRQGRWRASMSLFAMQNERRISTNVLDMNAPTDRRLTERYGPQPGNGLPPESPPTPIPDQ